MNFKANEVIFGGGRLKNISATTIPLDWDELVKVYDEANSNFFEESAEDVQNDELEGAEEEKEETDTIEPVEVNKPVEKKIEEPEVHEEKPARRTRRTRKVR